jgi:hypothetical protein
MYVSAYLSYSWCKAKPVMVHVGYRSDQNYKIQPKKNMLKETTDG